MRTALLTIFLCTGLISNAQNWALINPDYKYNYSNDGTDTIRNQIVVTHIDTLGVDSFRYELNRVAERCISCPGGCNLHINLPQFLQLECYVGVDKWRFNGTEQLVVRPFALMNETWLFDLGNGTPGTLIAISEQQIFGTMDSVRTMTTALNDTVSWSRNHGILRWHLHNGPRFNLIGTNGPQFGQVIPTLAQFFPYQPGDIVQFLASSMSNMHSFSTYQRFHIEERTEQQGHLEFSGSSYKRFIGAYGEVIYTYIPHWTWVLDSATQISLRPLRTWPGQPLNLDDISWSFANGDLLLVAKHHRDLSGNYIIDGENFNGSTLLDVLDTTSVDCLYLAAPQGNDYRLDTELGLRYFSWNAMLSGYSFHTLGAIINGDTVGIFHDDEFFHVGIKENSIAQLPIYPDPSSDLINVPDATPGSICTVLDAQGRTVTTRRITPAHTISVEDLRPGIYLLLVNGWSPQRFSVAR